MNEDDRQRRSGYPVTLAAVALAALAIITAHAGLVVAFSDRLRGGTDLATLLTIALAFVVVPIIAGALVLRPALARIAGVRVGWLHAAGVAFLMLAAGRLLMRGLLLVHLPAAGAALVALVIVALAFAWLLTPADEG